MRRLGYLSLLAIVTVILAATIWQPSHHGVMANDRPGSFSGIEGHDAAGHVQISRAEIGKPVLVIHDAEIDRVPDGRVYLTKNFDHRNGIELGRLTTFSGTLTFMLPLQVDLNADDSVVIWCKKFDVGIGQARLPGQGSSK